MAGKYIVDDIYIRWISDGNNIYIAGDPWINHHQNYYLIQPIDS